MQINWIITEKLKNHYKHENIHTLTHDNVQKYSKYM